VSSAATPPPDTTNAGEGRSTTRPGCLIFVVIAALIAAGIVATVKFWPRSMKDRQNAAIESCEDKVDHEYPTNADKQWRSADAVGPDKNHFEVTGRFSSKGFGNATFSCVVEHGKVTEAFVSPG
jgi:hypothetical protein